MKHTLMVDVEADSADAAMEWLFSVLNDWKGKQLMYGVETCADKWLTAEQRDNRLAHFQRWVDYAEAVIQTIRPVPEGE